MLPACTSLCISLDAAELLLCSFIFEKVSSTAMDFTFVTEFCLLSQQQAKLKQVVRYCVSIISPNTEVKSKI